MTRGAYVVEVPWGPRAGTPGWVLRKDDDRLKPADTAASALSAEPPPREGRVAGALGRVLRGRSPPATSSPGDPRGHSSGSRPRRGPGASDCPLGQEGLSELLPRNWTCWHQRGWDSGRAEARPAGRNLGNSAYHTQQVTALSHGLRGHGSWTRRFLRVRQLFNEGRV